MKIKDLTPNAKNPRQISDHNLAMLKKALVEFGDLSGIIYNRKTKQLVGGHQRRGLFDADSPVTVVKKYSRPTKTGTVAEGFVELDGERFSYREVYWDKHKEMAANIAANKGAGEWNQDQLTEWLKELGSFDVNFDMDLTMFDADELKLYAGIDVAGYTRTSATGVDEDEIPEKVPARTKLGDVYHLGLHRLLCGDSTNREQVERLMDGKIADVCFTSPPYNAGNFEPKGRVIEKFRADKDRKLPKMTQKYANDSDDRTDDEYFELLDRALLIGLSFSETTMFNISLLQGCKTSVVKLMGKYVDKFKEIIYWNKRSSTPHIVQGILTMIVEPIFCFGDFSSRKFPKGKFKGNLSNLIEGHNAGGDNVASGKHSATFPVYLPEHIIENFTESSVLDLFGGTGTTMIAAEKLNRKCFMMEIDPHYCDIIVERWEKYTGLKARLVRTETKRRPAKQVTGQVSERA